jgi:hypothetical protein
LLLAKELDRVAADLGDSVKILKVDTDENPDLSSQLQARRFSSNDVAADAQTLACSAQLR